MGSKLTIGWVFELICGCWRVKAYSHFPPGEPGAPNGVTYTWDANGNLLNDGVNTYAYDSANRLKTVTSEQSSVISFGYNGLGDRLQETLNGQTTTFTMDLNTGLTQALSDGTNTHLYGVDRIAQVKTGTEYFLGAGASAFAFTGEQQDASGLKNLRARYYASYQSVHEWEKPRLISLPCIDRACGTANRSWPSALRTVQPIAPEVWIRWFNEDALWEIDYPATGAEK